MATTDIMEVIKSQRGAPAGTDAPVTPLGPWEAIDAAVHHHQVEERVDDQVAFEAHSRAGWQAIGCEDAGVIAVGAPAHLAVWGAEVPRKALRTIVAGRTVHDTGELS